MYKTEKFELRPPEEIMADIDAVAALVRDLQEISRQRGQGGQVTREAAIELINRNPDLNQHHGFAMVFHWLLSGGKTAFIQDANSLIMPTDRMVTVLRHLRTTFPSINRVTTYARSKTIAGKKHEELTAIREAGLDRLHVGLESGDDTVLKRVKKGVTADGHIKGGRKAMAAGFQLSEYWMPGLGGRDRWEAHAQETARVLNAINPHYIRSRPFRPLPGTPMAEAAQQGDFQILSPHEELMELQRMVEALEITSRVCFDHAGNYWTDRRGDLLFTHSYEGYQFPDEKPKVLARIQEGLTADNQTPRFLRL